MAVSLPSTTSLSAATRWRTNYNPSFLDDHHAMVAVPVSVALPHRSRPNGRLQVRAGNVNEGKGIFAPLVVITRNIIGKKRFNQLRGKAIALHSQVITEFCKTIGADSKQRQGLIRLAKKNGEKLGFLA